MRFRVALSVIHALGIVGVIVSGFIGRFATDEAGYRAAAVAHVASGVTALVGVTTSGVLLARF